MYTQNELRSKISDTLTQASLSTGLNLNTPEAVDWLISVVAHESHMGKYHKQINGPARGILQMEPHVETDVWRNVLSLEKYKALADYIRRMPGSIEANDDKAIMMARAQMLRFPESFPPVDDREWQAKLWKKRWNTWEGRGTIDKFLADNKRLNPVKNS